jgi:hypothetical protein
MRLRARALAAAAALAFGCRGDRAAPPPPPTPPAAAPTAAPSYTPGLGELMTLQQMRHAKLWFAGQAGNWKLAAYEAKEIREGLGDIARVHPTHKDAPVPIDQAIETIMTDPLARLGEAIEKRDRRAFGDAYDTVTEGCNGCHQATDFGFNVVQRPSTNPFSNQSFAPPKE